MKTVAVVSGGMDSVTLAHLLQAEGHELALVSFDYGQRHNKELQYAETCARRLGVPIQQCDLRSVNQLLQGSALTTPDIEVPDGHYAEESMKATVVPNRNAVMISLAAALAVSVKAQNVAIGVHGGDHFIYPDCRPPFVAAMEQTITLGNEGMLHDDFSLVAPFLQKTKSDIVTVGEELGVPWVETWSCYKGDALHCGTCGTCVERQEAFALAGVEDPTVYQTGQK